MNFLDRAIAFVSPGIALNRAMDRARLTTFGYDAAEPGLARGRSGGMAKNASSESPRMARDRVKLMWDARDLERNLPIARCIIDRLSQYVCGTIKYQSRTGDATLDTVYDQYFEDWMRRVADLTGRHDFRTLARLAFRGAYRDGDYFVQVVRQGRALQVRCIEADRIGDPNKVGSNIERDLIQGIRINEVGAPVAYQVFSRDPKSQRYTFETEVAAKDICHLMLPIRADEYRTVSALAPVIGQLRDLYEMFQCELAAAKWASSISGIIRTQDPQFRLGPQALAQWQGENVDTANLPSYQAKANTLLRLRPNEDVTVFNNAARPNGAFVNFIDTSLRDIAMGLNIPYGFFDMAKFGGANVRLESQQLQRTFTSHQRNLEFKMLDPIKNMVLENGIALGDIPGSPNFKAGKWHFGAHLTADTGYDTDANLALLAHGVKTAAAVIGEMGDDADAVFDQLVKEGRSLQEKCSTNGVPIEIVAPSRFPAGTQQFAAVQDAMQEPPPAPKFDELGDSGMKTLLEVITSAARGELDREGAINLLITSYGYDPALAEAIVPEKKEHLVNPPQPAAKPGQPPKQFKHTDNGS